MTSIPTLGALLAVNDPAGRHGQRLEQLSGIGLGRSAQELEVDGMLATCIEMLLASDFTANDLRFLISVMTMMMATPPGALLEQLRTSAVSSPVSGDC